MADKKNLINGIEATDVPTLEEFKADWKPKARLALAAMGERCGVSPLNMQRMMNIFWACFDSVTDEQVETLYEFAYGNGLPEIRKVEIARVH